MPIDSKQKLVRLIQYLKFWDLLNKINPTQLNIFADRDFDKFLLLLKNNRYTYKTQPFRDKTYTEFDQKITVLNQRGERKGEIFLSNGRTHGYFFILKNERDEPIGYYIIGDGDPLILHEMGHLKDEMEIAETLQTFKNQTLNWIAAFEVQCIERDESQYQRDNDNLEFFLTNYSINTRLLLKNVDHPSRIPEIENFLQAVANKPGLRKIEQITAGIAILIAQKYGIVLNFVPELKAKYPLINLSTHYLEPPINALSGKMLDPEICSILVDKMVVCLLMNEGDVLEQGNRKKLLITSYICKAGMDREKYKQSPETFEQFNARDYIEKIFNAQNFKDPEPQRVQLLLVNFIVGAILRLNWEPKQVPIKEFGAFIPIGCYHSGYSCDYLINHDIIPDDYIQVIEYYKSNPFDPAQNRIEPPILYESDDRVIVWDGTHRIFGLYYNFLKNNQPNIEIECLFGRK